MTMLLVWMLVGALGITVGLALPYLLWKGGRRVYRRWQLSIELDSPDLRNVSPPIPPADHRQSPGSRLSVPPMRPGSDPDPGAARVLAFHERLAARGQYVDELTIQRFK